MKIVVIDDDPTGSQTVHGCPLLLRWDSEALEAGLRHPSPLLFILANTRALAPEAAAARVREICAALKRAATALGLEDWLLVSRGDSTLRGHFPLEVEVMAAELGPFDATLLVPAFLEGGRTTVAGVHRVRGVEAHLTEFAGDRLFGYRNSFLPAWVEEKSGGRIPAAAVERISLSELEAIARQGQGERESDGQAHQLLVARLSGFQGNPVVAVDAERPEHLAALGGAVRELMGPTAAARWGRPRRFLFQSAASLLNGLANLPPQPLGAENLAGLRRRGKGRWGGSGPSAPAPMPGMVMVGSHVPLATSQLAQLLEEKGCGGVELDVEKIQRILASAMPERRLASLEAEWVQRLRWELASGRTPVLYTSRGEAVCRQAEELRTLGMALARLMGRITARLAPQLGYVISKGGITSHTLLAEGLELGAVELMGQLLPGLSLVLTPAANGDSLGSSGPGGVAGADRLPVLTFPGNLGDSDTLTEAWRWMEGMGVPP